MKRKFKIAMCLTAFYGLFVTGIVFAQEDYEEDFMRIEFEAEETPKDELQSMQSRLSELEFYYSELKAQEVPALRGVPASMKNKKFKTVSEKAKYYKDLADEYAGKLANEELSKSDIKVSQNLMILSELYETQQAVSKLKQELEKKKADK